MAALGVPPDDASLQFHPGPSEGGRDEGGVEPAADEARVAGGGPEGDAVAVDDAGTPVPGLQAGRKPRSFRAPVRASSLSPGGASAGMAIPPATSRAIPASMAPT